MARTKEQIIADIKADKDFADLPHEEIEEMAEMELKEQGNRRYEQSNTPRKKAERPKKIDEVKVKILQEIGWLLAELPQISNFKITNPQKTIDFTIGKDLYTLTLTKHRPK